MTAYETDGYAWAMHQADALRRRSANEVDWDNLAEEVEAMAGADRRELRNRYVVLLMHLLTWMYQPAFRSRSWKNTISGQRDILAMHLEENPSLAAQEHEQFLKAYRLARREAERETGLDLRTFPEAPPFTLEQAREEGWLPDTAPE